MNKTHPIAEYMHPFFYQYLPNTKGVSAHTIFSYRDTFKLFLRFAARDLEQSPDRLKLEDLNEKMILRFLDYLEKDVGNSISTRNARLAGIRSFFSFVGRETPEMLDQCRKIRFIPTKRKEHRMIDYLNCEEMKAVFNAVGASSRTELRDRALLHILYNTGARVKEVVDLMLVDLKLDPPSQVKMLGKGRKRRACPLWPETVECLRIYINKRQPKDAGDQNLFLNANGKVITRFGVRYIIRNLAKKAALKCPSLREKSIGPHTFRHSTAMHLLQAGNDINLVRLWLGHANINTTHIYIEMDMEMKKKILETTMPPSCNGNQGKLPKWQKTGILQWLDNLSKQVSAD